MMLEYRWLWIGICVLFLSATAAPAFEDGDTQYWSAVSASWKAGDQWKMKIEQEFRFGDDMSNYYHGRTDVGAAYSGLADWLVLGFNYRAANDKTSQGWKLEHRPHLNVLLKTDAAGFALSNNNRLEFRMRKSAEDKMRYRNKTTVRFPWKWTDWQIRPFLADEIFLETESVEMSRNRFYAGIGAKLTKNLGMELYYMRQNDKTVDNDWNDTHVWGTKFDWAF